MIKRHGWDCLSFSSSLIQHYVFSLYFWISLIKVIALIHVTRPYSVTVIQVMGCRSKWLGLFWKVIGVTTLFAVGSSSFIHAPRFGKQMGHWCRRGRRGEAWDREWWDSFIYGPPVFFSSMLPPLPSSSSLFLNPGRKRIASSPCEINKISGESPSFFICYGNRPSKWKIHLKIMYREGDLLPSSSSARITSRQVKTWSYVCLLRCKLHSIQ